MWKRGAEWRKWDLHVHTPDSLYQKYSGPDPWDRFLTELQTLDPDVSVLGINDYWFLDGYKKVRAEFESGRFPNLDEVFPVIEVRTENFGGTDGKLRRINLHFVCDPGLSAEVLEAQLIAPLRPTYRLSDGDPYESWSQIVTRESLEDLGRKIKSQVPAAELHRFSSDLVEGFNNVCVPFGDAINAVRQNTALVDRVLVAVGKTEWAALRWNDQSVATKKTLLNSADLVFTAAESRDDFRKSRQVLIEARVNSRLLDCSDAHTWTDSADKDRLGNTFTWINADPTFKGLLHALQEYNYRVTTESRPAALLRLATRPSTIINRVNIRPILEQTVSPLFNCSIDLNPGFVVILGNKGQGKSALLDILAAGANSDRYDDYSFLTPARFRRRNGEAQDYLATLSWADGRSASVGLNEPFTKRQPIRVDYLPQSLIERVCLADPYSKQERRFESEIERVVFGHIDPIDRGESTSLKQYLERLSGEAQISLRAARDKISYSAKALTRMQDRRAELQNLGLDARLGAITGQVNEVEEQIKVRELQLSELREAAGAKATQTELQGLVGQREKLVEERNSALQKVRNSREDIENFALLEAKLLEHFDAANAVAEEIEHRTGIDAKSLLLIELNDGLIRDWREGVNRSLAAQQLLISEANIGIDAKIAATDQRIHALTEELRQRTQGSERLVEAITDLAERRRHLIGDVSNPNSLSGIQALLEELRGIPDEEAVASNDLKAGFFDAHKAAMSIFSIQRSAYKDAADFVASHELARKVGLEFEVDLRVKGFTASWMDMVNKQRLSELNSAFESPAEEALLDGVALHDAEQMYSILLRLQGRLGAERGSISGAERRLSSVMRTGYSAADLLNTIYGLRWFEGEYVIRSFGAELAELSPGQRGLVLLMFYLLIDRSDKPLLLDQPEENLDNQTVREFLIPALRAAVDRRQVIAVTHNPNLAVVGDADQIIVASHQGGIFEYEAGSLSDLAIGTQSIDVLEGTRAAFDNREEKYDRVVGKL
ncbi:TrlF family AAA-like ATPase [Micromonospora arida]